MFCGLICEYSLVILFFGRWYHIFLVVTPHLDPKHPVKTQNRKLKQRENNIDVGRVLYIYLHAFIRLMRAFHKYETKILNCTICSVHMSLLSMFESLYSYPRNRRKDCPAYEDVMFICCLLISAIRSDVDKHD